jgi:hypothetical protein
VSGDIRLRILAHINRARTCGMGDWRPRELEIGASQERSKETER